MSKINPIKLHSFILCIFSLYATPVFGMNDTFGQKSDTHGAWPNFANQARYPWDYHNQHYWPQQHYGWPTSGPFTEQDAWDFIKQINCQHHWSCPHYQRYSYGMHYQQTCCWQGRCNGYTPVHHGDKHIGKIFAFGSVVMAISLYYLYRVLYGFMVVISVNAHTS